MQNLANLTFEIEPFPRNHKEYEIIMAYAPSLEPKKQENIMLTASNAFVFIGSLDSSTFKQVASTLYNAYNKETDKSLLSIKQLEERLKVDYPSMINPMFNNGLGEAKSTLMALRNLAGHSDIGLKIDYSMLNNSSIWINDKPEKLYETLQSLSCAYLKKVERVYAALAKEVSLVNGTSTKTSEIYLQNMLDI
jgi:hypothetical protein